MKKLTSYINQVQSITTAETLVHIAVLPSNLISKFLSVLLPYEVKHGVERVRMEKDPRSKLENIKYKFFYKGANKSRFNSFYRDLHKNLWPDFNLKYPKSMWEGK